MNTFEEIKKSIDIQNVIERYTGQSFNRNFTKCVFHNDGHSSLSVNKNLQRFNCWACQTGGDAIDFTAKFFDMKPYEAAKKIDSDFSLNVVNMRYDKKMIKQREKEQKEKEEFDEWCKEAYKTLANYYCENCRNLEHSWEVELADYLCDILLYESTELKKEVRGKYGSFIERVRNNRVN